MPLPSSGIERTRMHQRNVKLEGFKRADGLWDIEAHLLDTKDHDYPLSSGLRSPGDALHGMRVRVTIDAKMNILDATACADATPYNGMCDCIVPNYSKLIGLNLFHGFRKSVKELFGGTLGCSHITELIMFLPTVALQTFASDVRDNDDSKHKPYQLDKCHALTPHSEAVRHYYPRWYRDPKAG